MMKRSRNNRILHSRREVSTDRPMHLTVHTRADVPSLRTDAARDLFRGLLAAAKKRGVETVAFVMQRDHIHWVAVPQSREALQDATRHVFGQFARRLNRMLGRRGSVWVERYWSSSSKTVRHAWNVFNYVLRNPDRAGLRPAPGALDAYTTIDDAAVAADRFLRSVLGLTPEQRRALYVRMSTATLAFVPLRDRLQPYLPGL